MSRLAKENVGELDKMKYLEEHGVPEKNIIHAKNTSDTMQEVVFVKNYMLKHQYKSVIFVSNFTHSRRIMYLAKSVNNYDDANLSCIVVGSDIEYWDRNYYYKDKRARKDIVISMSKLVHNFIKYGVLQKLGLLEVVKNNFGPFIHFFTGKVYRYLVGTDQ